ncbi:exonuclease domain-containing protein [Paenibacillus doosanensis]|uniref:3'-5' exonuclease n=1 Tax=Paenibacillus doosanensis TaxID=1229154 RepID=UPI0021801262|nr:3'-5' exonuclease [Paenibacillus doosanensis]MCS7458620.1 exonuclease domain-containing protein [Paenibacillus doosanensis]
MNYIVIDLEFNGRKHYDIYPMEIIEIGAVKLNDRLEIVDTFQSYINPNFYINRFALQFCGITKETLHKSARFHQVIREFRAFCGEEYTILAWGGGDFFHLFLDCKINQVSGDWLVNLLDVTSFFEGGLQQALVEHELEPVGQHHSALDDALNTARLLQLKPDVMRSDAYFVPNHFKLCTGGIKKWITLSLDSALEQDKLLTWKQFAGNDKTKTYFKIMRLDAEEIEMVHELFTKFFNMKYGRKAKTMQQLA